MTALIPSIGKVIKQIRKEKGLSLTQIRDKTGIEANYLSRIETGKIASPRVKTMIKIAKALGITIDEIFIKAFGKRPITDNPGYCSKCGQKIKNEDKK